MTHIDVYRWESLYQAIHRHHNGSQDSQTLNPCQNQNVKFLMAIHAEEFFQKSLRSILFD